MVFGMGKVEKWKLFSFITARLGYKQLLSFLNSTHCSELNEPWEWPAKRIWFLLEILFMEKCLPAILTISYFSKGFKGKRLNSFPFIKVQYSRSFFIGSGAFGNVNHDDKDKNGKSLRSDWIDSSICNQTHRQTESIKMYAFLDRR